MRHTIKPLAYLRYGDDFVVFCPTLRGAHKVRVLAEGFLLTSLGLTINPRNNVVVATQHGLKFLGHDITHSSVLVDKHTTKSVLGKTNWYNAASYKSLLLAESEKRNLNWILLQKYIDI
jgi:hypothetical protein